MPYAGPALGLLISMSKWKRLEAVQNIGLRNITAFRFFVRNSTILNTVRQGILNEIIRNNYISLFHRKSRSRMHQIRSLSRAQPNSQITRVRPFQC